MTRQSTPLIHLIAMPHRFAITIRLFVILALVLQVLTPVLPVFAPSSALAAAAAPTPSSVPPAAHDGMPLGALPLATATITPTATIIPTAVAVAAENLNLNLNLDLALDPPWAAPGEVVTFTVTATNLLSTPLPGLVLTATLPDGLVYVAGSAVSFGYEPSHKRLTWPAGELAAGATVTGSFQARVQGLALGETITSTVTATSPALAAPGLATAALAVVSPRNNEVWVTPESGGWLRAADDRVLLQIPPGAVATRTRFTFQAERAVPDPLPGLLLAFRVAAWDAAGQPLTQVAAPLTLTWAARPREIPGTGARLTLYVYDETAQQWVALPTQVEPLGRLWRVRLSRLALFAFVRSAGFVPEVMPNIRGIQNDLFTGSASIAYPIALPPGRGGLTPDLTLQFNSQSRQGDAGNASLVGTGWKLSADSFVYWTPFNPGSAPPTWRLAGAAYTEAGNASTGWYFREAPQWRIDKPTDGNGALDAYAPDGTRYHFEPALHDWYNLGANARVDKWALQYVRDAQGNQVDYVYDSALPVDPWDVRNQPGNYEDALGPRYRRYEDFDFGVYYLAQINLKEIRYNGGQTVVAFEHATRPDAPEPFCAPNDLAIDTDVWGHFTTRLVTGIRVRQGGQWVAGYKLSYDHWGNAATCAAWARSALQTIARCSDERLTNCLPATSFTNTPQVDGNNGMLTQYDNGYGGRVGFTYTWDVAAATAALTTRTVTDTVTGQIESWTYSYGSPVAGVGFQAATETLPPSLGSGNTIYHHFLEGSGVDAGFRGKEDQQSVTVGGMQQQAVTRVWAGTTTGVNGGGKLVYLSEETQTTYDKDGLNPLARKTVYSYDLDYQGGAQYGNATRIAEYADASDATPYRTTLHRYVPNPTAWIVNQPAASNVYTGSVPAPPTPPDTSQLAASTWYIYSDDQANPPPAWNQPVGSKGQLRGVRRYQGVDGGGNHQYVDTRYWHDAYGNVTAAQTYRAYGTANAWASAVANTVTTSYDATFATYPLSVTVTPDAALGGPPLTTTYTYYGVNPDTGGGFGLVGQLQQESDPNDAATRYQYDGFGRAQALARPGDTLTLPTVTYTYTDSEQPFRIITTAREASGCSDCEHPTVTFYDGLGQALQTKAESQDRAEMIVTDTRYNALGLAQAQYAPYKLNDATTFWNFVGLNTAQPKTTTLYDALGRVVKVVAPDNTWVDTVYHGRQTAVLDALGHQTIQAVDAFGRLATARQYSGSYAKNPPAPGWGDAAYATATYTYNLRDQLETVTGPDGAVTDPTYNLLGQKTRLVDPDLGTWHYAYDALGNLQTQTDARGCASAFSYDGHNRLTGKRYTGPPECGSLTAVGYTYDAFDGLSQFGRGRRTGMTDGSGSTSWTYDARGRVTAETKVVSGAGGGTFNTQWWYDALDRPAWQRYPGGNAGQAGEQVSFAYAPSTWLQSVSGAAMYVGDTGYNALGQVTERRLGSTTGVVRQLYTYTAAENFRLVSQQAGTAAPYTDLQSLSYTHDDTGNVLTISDAAAYGGSQVQTFSYDFLDRLQTAQATGGGAPYGEYAQQSYGYSNAGNLTSFEGAAYAYNDAVHKHALTHINGVQKYWYDANGNATKRITDATYDLTYDAENRLTQLQKNGGVSGTYVYDGDGNRVKEMSGSVTTVYIGNYCEWTGDAAAMKSYYYAGGTRIALRTGTASSGTVNYLLTDHLGSTSLTLDSAGGRLNPNTELRYYPYGAPRYDTNNHLTSFDFTGQRKDSGSGLLFYNARWYDPVAGRFLQADTIVSAPGDPQSLNRYSYVRNNPLRYVDPSGHDPLDQAWQDEFQQVHHRAPTAEDVQIRLFSIAFPNEWDWSAFYNADGSYITGSLEAVFRDQRPATRSWKDMPGALEQLAGWYKAGEEAFYTRDVGSLFAGLLNRFEAPEARHAIYNNGGGSARVWVYFNRDGFSSTLMGNSDDDANVHHWAWALTAGAAYGPGGSLINIVRETGQFTGDWRNTWSDVSIGNRGAALGAHFRVLGLADVTRAWNFFMLDRWF